MKHKYGDFVPSQISSTKKKIQKSIFFLLLCVDPKTKDQYSGIDVDDAFRDILYKISGLNEILFHPAELVTVISLLEAALVEYNKIDFRFPVYRKLILDAGAEVLKIGEVDKNA